MHKFELKDEWRPQNPAFPFKADSKIENVYLIPINWILAPYKNNRTKGTLEFGEGKRKLWLGFCMATEHLIKIRSEQDFLSALLVRDTYVTAKDGKFSCEEGRRCLNIDCPANNTTKESFVSNLGIEKSKSKKINWEAATSFRELSWEELKKSTKLIVDSTRKET